MSKAFIERVYNDELEHRQIFSRLYCYFTDTNPVCHIEPIGYPCYKEGLLAAMVSELETVEFYRNVQLSTTDPLIIDTFFLAMVDEQKHATIFSMLFSTYSECRK